MLLFLSLDLGNIKFWKFELLKIQTFGADQRIFRIGPFDTPTSVTT